LNLRRYSFSGIRLNYLGKINTRHHFLFLIYHNLWALWGQCWLKLVNHTSCSSVNKRKGYNYVMTEVSQ
jgi:hypothetical protein